MSDRVVEIEVVVLPHGEGLPLPDWQTAGAAGADVHAAIDSPLVLSPGDRALVPAGFCMALPSGWEMQVRPRSGLAVKHGVTVLNSPGTIDSDYRGEVQVALINHGRETFVVERGDRIAQLVLAPVHVGTWKVVGVLAPSMRGSGGFGSTGR